MRMNDGIISVIIAVTQSQRTRALLVTLAIVMAAFGVAGCPAPHH